MKTNQRSKLNRKIIPLILTIIIVFAFAPTVYASTPLESVNKLSDLIFDIIRAIGLILLGFGIVQIGMSLKSHDPSQRASGMMAFFGGVVIAFAKDILDLIM